MKGADLDAGRQEALFRVLAQLTRLFDEKKINDGKVKIQFLVNNPSVFKSIKALENALYKPLEIIKKKLQLIEKQRNVSQLDQEEKHYLENYKDS